MLRPATDADLDAMRSWRNQQANREVSIRQHLISVEEHRAWWARAQADPTRRDLIFSHADRPLGVVNFFDLTDEGPERTGMWGFYLDHETTQAEGTALLVWQAVMREAIGYAFDELGLDVLYAEVLAENEAVRATNRRYRFVEGEVEQREVDGRILQVIPVSLRAEDRRGARRGRSARPQNPVPQEDRK